MKSNTIITVIIALVIGAGGYWLLTGTNEQPTLTTTGSENATQTRFKTLISALPASFNTAIFFDTRFAALVDITTQISPESSGRLDPFAPIPAGGK